MRAEAAKAGLYHWEQITITLVIDEILNGKKVDYLPSRANVTFNKAPKNHKGFDRFGTNQPGFLLYIMVEMAKSKSFLFDPPRR